jgi:hypothetical protein
MPQAREREHRGITPLMLNLGSVEGVWSASQPAALLQLSIEYETV